MHEAKISHFEYSCYSSTFAASMRNPIASIEVLSMVVDRHSSQLTKCSFYSLLTPLSSPNRKLWNISTNRILRQGRDPHPGIWDSSGMPWRNVFIRHVTSAEPLKPMKPDHGRLQKSDFCLLPVHHVCFLPEMSLQSIILLFLFGHLTSLQAVLSSCAGIPRSLPPKMSVELHAGTSIF